MTTARVKIVSAPSPELGPDAHLVGADLRDQDLSGVDLSGADLSRADLTGANLSLANLAGAVLHETVLEGAELSGADLSDVDASSSRCGGASFGRAKLGGASFFDADLHNATLSMASAVDADFRQANLSGARICDTDLSGAEMALAKLNDADLSGSSVLGTGFVESDLRRARLRGLRGYKKATFLRADVRDVDFSGAYLLRRQIMDENFLYEFKNQDRAHRVVYNIWWLTSDCGRSITRWAGFTVAIAVLFAFAYGFVDIDFGSHPTALSQLYFSVVTLTTLGYGDVLPASGAAQVVTMAQVIIGYVMLGGLLSIVSNKMARRAD